MEELHHNYQTDFELKLQVTFMGHKINLRGQFNRFLIDFFLKTWPKWAHVQDIQA